MQIRTDMAAELTKEYDSAQTNEIRQNEYEKNGVKVSVTDILSDSAEEKTGKEKGRYITISFSKDDYDDASVESTVNAAKEEFEEIFGNRKSTLVVGLGNPSLTADAIGPKTAEKLVVTRHLKGHAGFDTLGLGEVCQITPNVLGKTGIETAELVKSVVSSIRPDAVVVIDALAAREKSRLCKNIQLSNTGIRPGSGVGNHRNALDRQTLGIPVFSIGVPTVIDLSDEKNGGLIVTPKDIDLAVERCSDVISGFLNKVFHPKAEKETLSVFLNS